MPARTAYASDHHHPGRGSRPNASSSASRSSVGKASIQRFQYGNTTCNWVCCNITSAIQMPKGDNTSSGCGQVRSAVNIHGFCSGSLRPWISHQDNKGPLSSGVKALSSRVDQRTGSQGIQKASGHTSPICAPSKPNESSRRHRRQ